MTCAGRVPADSAAPSDLAQREIPGLRADDCARRCTMGESICSLTIAVPARVNRRESLRWREVFDNRSNAIPMKSAPRRTSTRAPTVLEQPLHIRAEQMEQTIAARKREECSRFSFAGRIAFAEHRFPQ